MPDIGDWLRSIKLEAIEPLFREQNIEFEVLRDLTDQDLREIGISLGHRKRLLRAIAEIVEEDIGTQSDPVAGSAATEGAAIGYIASRACWVAAVTGRRASRAHEAARAVGRATG